jgi:outer membrane protein TolC
MAAKAERATRAADLTDAQAAIRSRNIAIIRLMNPASGAEAWTTQYEPVDPADVIQVALEPAVCEQLAIKYRPELAQARLDVANLQLEKTRTKNALLPKLDFVASYGLKSQGTYPNAISNELDNSDYDNYRVGLQFQTPILNRAERAKNTRSKLLAEQGERSLSNLEQALGAEVRQAAVEVQKQWERIAATESALKSRVEQLRVAQGRFDAGKTTNLDLMIVQRDFIQSQVDAVTARVRYIQALTALYAAEGTLLDRRGITMDFVAKSAQPGM